MAENLGELIVSVSADITRLQEGLTKAGVLTEETAVKTEAATSKIGLLWAAAAAVVVTALGSMIKSTVEYSEQILKASEKTGIATESLSKLRYAAEQSDVSFDSVVNGLKFLERSLFNVQEGNAKLAIAFQELGVKTTDVNGRMKSTETVLMESADAFKNIHNEAEKTALVMQIFGRAGTEMLPLLNQGSAGIKEMEDRAKSLGLELTKENAESIHDFEKNIKDVKAAFGGLSLEITNDIYPALDGFIKKITDAISTTRQFLNDVKSGNLMKMLANEAGLGGDQPFQGQETAYGREQDKALGFTSIPATVDPNAQKIKNVQALEDAEKKASDARMLQSKQAENNLAVQKTQFAEFANSVVKTGTTIQGAFTTALSALILHGGSAKEIFQALGQTLVQSLVDFVAEQLIAHTIGQFIKTAEAAAISAFGVAAATSLAPAAAFMEIITLGGATGPATAGLSATVLAAHSISGFAEGTDTVPSMLSPGEMVVPRSFSDALRAGDLTLGGRGQNVREGDSNIVVNVNAVINHPVDIQTVAKEIAFQTSRELRYLRPR